MHHRGFSFTETLITAFLVSSLALGLTIYMKRSGLELRSSDQSENLRSQVDLTQNQLKNDIRQVVYINPACDENAPADRAVTAACSEIIFKAGFTPYPGESRQAMNGRFDLEISDSTDVAAEELSFMSDAARLVLFDFEETYFCRLDENVALNPSSDDDYALTASSDCPELQLGGLYVIMEDMGNQIFSNLFQITALSGGGGSPYVITADYVGLFNQSAPLGASGFTNKAQIFPVYLVEFAVSTEGGLYRREIRPQASDDGYGDWALVNSLVEALQFSFLTLPETGVKNYVRTLNFSGSEFDKQLSDLRGLNASLVLKSEKSHPKQIASDNPLTATIENDGYARKDSHFYINFRNANLD